MTTDMMYAGGDPFAAFQAAASALSGGDSKPILKFEKGDWYAGQDKEEMPLKSKLAADMLNAEWGWVRWKDGRPAERRMTLVASGQPAPTRDALGHLDEGLWEVDGVTGRSRDPWQFMIEIPAREVGGERREYLLSGGSKGWSGCCKALFAAFGQGMRANAGKVPVIELGSERYTHKQYGIVKVPALPLVEWKAEAELAGPAPEKVKKLTKF